MSETAPQGGSLTVQASWLMLARTIAFVFSFGLPLLIVRRLSQSDMGLYRQIFLLIASTTSVLPLSFHMSAFYFLPRHKDRHGSIALNITVFFAVIALVWAAVLYLFPNLLLALFNTQELVPLAPLISLVVFLWVATSFLEYLAMANLEVRMATMMIIGLQLSRTILLSAAALFFGSVRALLWAAALQGLMQGLALMVYLQSRFKPWESRFDFKLMKSQLSYALPLGFAALLYSLQLDIHNYFVSHVYGVTTFAVYSIGCFQVPLIHILSDSVGAVMIPRVNILQKENRHREILILTSRMMRKLALIYFPFYVSLLVLAREFIIVLFTTRYTASWPIFAVNLTLILAYFMSSIYDPIMRAFAEHRFFLLRIRAVLLTALIFTLWFGTARLGLVGVITVVVVVNFIERLIALIKVGSILSVSRSDLVLLKDVGKIAVAAAISGSIALIVRSTLAARSPLTVLIVSGTVFWSIYAVLLWLWISTPDERARIIQKLSGLPHHRSRERIVEPAA